MKVRRIFSLLLFCSLMITLYLFFSRDNKTLFPQPTDKTIVKMGEEGQERAKREAWFELMHSAAPGTDWKQLEYQNRLLRHKKRKQQAAFRSDCGIESFADGELSGSWAEWGSSNQAGSVFDTEYAPETDELWLISAGGTLWKGDIFGNQWDVVNQDLRFTPGVLKFIPYNGGRRMIAFTGRLPHYSDDDGQSWTPASGITHHDSWGNIHSPIVVGGDIPSCYVLAKPDYWADIQLFRSVDYGETYLPVSTFNTWDFRKLILTSPHHSNDLYLIEKMDNNSAKIYLANPNTGQLEWINEGTNINYGGARANLTGMVDEQGNLHLYIYTNPTEGLWQVRRSMDGGINWELMGDLPVPPWEVGLYVSPNNPDVLFMGEVECYRSLNAGQNWEKTNNWWDYYDDIEGSLHADIMHFSGYERADGQSFLLISNHGGISISYDNLATAQNIALSGLNVSQYYSVKTDPIDPQYVYAGSQDQGFQRSADFDETAPAAFDQVISGDYGHIVFGNEGQHLWTVYPGGWVTYYNNPHFGNSNASYDLISEEESVWLPPLMSSPFPGDNGIYMAGGNVNGGPGSYLIRLEPQGQNIHAEQIEFNFSSNSNGGQVSAMDVSPSDFYKWYAATTNGRFFYSEDGGYNWEQSVNFIPEGHYLYGQTIYASKLNANTVYLGGSGYSNPAIYKSTDGGQNFEAMANGLPPTLVFELDANEDESLIFAATEAGPYVYVAAKEQWFDLSGLCAPAQTYWCVEFLPAQQIARFGTYGRGIWDFELEEMVNQKEVYQANITVYPNPATEQLFIELPKGQWDVQLMDASGKILTTQLKQTGQTSIAVNKYPAGTYQVIFVQGEKRWAETIIVK